MGHNDNDQPVPHPLHSKAMETEGPRAKARRAAREREALDQDQKEQGGDPDASRQPRLEEQ
jgi:hypothetical protein